MRNLNNKLIAEFMKFNKTIIQNDKGITYDYILPNNFKLIKETETTIESQWCEILMEQDLCMLEDLKFDTDWNWLILVVEKIESLDYLGGVVTITQGQCKITSRSAGDHSVYAQKSYYVEMGAKGKLKATYEAVVEFIEWYNKQ